MPFVRLSEIYTDNLSLAPQGMEESDHVTELTPGLLVVGDGANLSMNADMRWQSFVFADNDELNTTNFVLSTDGVVEAKRGVMFIDFSAQRDQESRTTNDGILVDPIADTKNFVDVTQFFIGPRMEERFGSYAYLSARYRYGEVDYEEDAAAHSVVQNGVIDARGGDDPVYKWRWIGNLAITRIEDDNQKSEQREYGSLEVGRWFSPKLLGLVRSGFAHDELTDTTNFENGSFWSVGMEWQPYATLGLRLLSGNRDSEAGIRYQSRSRRTEIDMNWRNTEVGLRSEVGTAFAGLLRYSGSHINMEVSYQKESTNEQILRLEDSQQTEVGPITDPTTGDPITPDSDLFGLTNANFIRTRTDIGMAYTTVRTVLGMGVYEEDRRSLNAPIRENVDGVRLSWKWSIKPYTDFLIRTEYQHTEYSSGQEDDANRHDIGLLHEFTRNFNTSLTYRYADRESTDPSLNFEEHRVTLSFDKRF